MGKPGRYAWGPSNWSEKSMPLASEFSTDIASALKTDSSKDLVMIVRIVSSVDLNEPQIITIR